MSDQDLFLDIPEQILGLEEISFHDGWSVVASNSRVLKSWRDLVLSCPENAIRCHRHLRSNPMQRSSGRIFPLKGKKFKGGWEYEITGSQRVFYIPKPDDKSVIVYYAGKHPTKNKYPRPPII